MTSFRLLAATALALVVGACSTLPGRDGTADAVLAASGLSVQLDRLREPLPPGKTDGPTGLVPDELLVLVNTAIADNLQPERIRTELKAALEKELTARELGSVQAFYESATGMRVVALETGRATGPRNSALDTARLDELAAATGAGRAVAQLAERGLNDAVDVALKNGCFGADRIPMANLLGGVLKKAQLAALRDSVSRRVREQYASLSTQEVEDYIAFTRSGAGRKFLDARTRVLGNAAGRTGDALKGRLT
ncbi:MAG: hypothetical protein ACK4UT_06465, partial [Moraxellaceae bacterium]